MPRPFRIVAVGATLHHPGGRRLLLLRELARASWSTGAVPFDGIAGRVALGWQASW